jgi:hypothetical protein
MVLRLDGRPPPDEGGRGARAACAWCGATRRTVALRGAAPVACRACVAAALARVGSGWPHGLGRCAGCGAREALVATDRLADPATGACYGCLVAALDQVAAERG